MSYTTCMYVNNTYYILKYCQSRHMGTAQGYERPTANVTVMGSNPLGGMKHLVFAFSSLRLGVLPLNTQYLNNSV